MPDLSTTGGEIRVVRWLVDVGQSIRRGQPLLEVETDKATMEVESVETGRLKEQVVEPDATVAVGEVIGIVEAKDKAATNPNSGAPVLSSGAEAAARTENPAPPTAVRQRVEAGGMFARNRRAAEEGSHQSVCSLSPTQQVVARRMLQSKQSIPHYYLQTSANVGAMVLRRDSETDQKIAWDAYFVFALARAIDQYPRMCGRLQQDRLVMKTTGSVGVAVDVENELYVVCIEGAAQKAPVLISQELRTAANKIKANAPDAQQLQSTDMTITNLGMENVESFIPIINPPETAILGIGKVSPQAVVANGEVSVQHRVNLTLAVDHRVVNGRYAAQFLGHLVDEIEDF